MKISDEMLAAYLEGNTNKEQTQQVLNALKTDAELRAMVEIAMAVDEELDEELEKKSNKESEKRGRKKLGNSPETLFTKKPGLKSQTTAPVVTINILPMMQLAAKDDENICSIVCEAYILHRRNIEFDSNELLVTAREKHWLKTEGTPLHAIGQLLALKGLLITRKYDATIDDLVRVLALDNDVIVAVDIQKLYKEHLEVDLDINHAIVVTAVDVDSDIVSIFDPQERKHVDIPMSFFLRAWHDSRNYMVRVLQSIDEYEPEPIRLDDVTLSDNLIELREAIAENLHEVWAVTRMKEGWTYGPVRNDEKKQHPDLIPYCALPDSEREYDRLMAWNTLKLVKKLGFEIKMP